ncbi:MAG: ribonuclease HI [Nitrospinota bacterium]
MKEVKVFSDGACRGNPGPGGYGVLVVADGKVKEISGSEKRTTNNRMEMIGALRGLEAVKTPSKIIVTTDSNYVVKGMTEWLAGWMKRGWRTAGGSGVKNRELWEKLVTLSEKHAVRWKWVKGHNGHAENERCDALANMAIDEMLSKNY